MTISFSTPPQTPLAYYYIFVAKMNQNEKTNKDKPYLSYQKWARPWWDHSISFSFSRKAIPQLWSTKSRKQSAEHFAAGAVFSSLSILFAGSGLCVYRRALYKRALCSVAVHPPDLLYLNCLFFSRALTHSFTLILIHQGTININVIREKDK